ncbi:MAG TPA: hypothetical protein VFX60_12700, partial [Micromonospora sp.]|nr:hypothetical protein [Micromonospora sp.]
MVTYAQLQAEQWWGREVVTPELDWLGSELCRRTGRPRTAFGHKGNDRHLNGGHRSQEWIKNSRYCTNRTYTVQSGLTATQARYIAAADFTPGVWGTAANRQLMVAQTKRLVAAMKAGRLPGVREVIGTLDGKKVTGTRADGSTFSSDSSHLDHWHLTFDRRRAADRSLMERIVAVALGEDSSMAMQLTDKLTLAQVPDVDYSQPTTTVGGILVSGYAYLLQHRTRTARELAALRQLLEALLEAQAGKGAAAIIARIDEHAAAEAERDAQAAAERAELRALVEQVDSGELAADRAFERMRTMVHAATAP